jgi:hypothetical protein
MTDPIDDAEITARQSARFRADQLRQAQKTRERRRRWIFRGGIAVGIVAVVAIVIVVLISFARPSGRGPANMLSDGIVIGNGLKAERTPPLLAGHDPVPTGTGGRDLVRIRLYVDYFQPGAKAFEKANGAQLREWAQSGAATVEIHPVALAGTGPDGAQYSLRAANAAACVAQFSPDRFFAFSDALLRAQPGQQTAGLDANRIIRIAEGAQVSRQSDVADCIREMRFQRWVQAASQRASTGPIAGSDVKNVSSTPTVLINGTKWDSTDPADSSSLAEAFVGAIGDSFNDPSATPSATPSPTPTG